MRTAAPTMRVHDGRALASVTLLSTQSATAAPAEPKPAIEDVQKKVDELYRQARQRDASSTNRAGSPPPRPRQPTQGRHAALRRGEAETEKINEARRELGAYAAEQYRTGGIAPTATFFLADDPQAYFDQSRG
ncbi:NlpC/P60 family protein OS=Streptomyces microflavus OX=1919 GN=Smic_50390 PE=4 SV=1 [Streptomyces microflavus]